MTTREDVVSEARSWIGTKFHHQGRVKKAIENSGGCDCIGLILGVAEKLQLRDRDGVLLTEHDHLDYGKIPDGMKLKQELGARLTEVSLEEALPGDIALFRFDSNPQHVGFLSDYIYGGLGVIHCYAEARRVIESRLDRLWKSKLETCYKIET